MPFKDAAGLSRHPLGLHPQLGAAAGAAGHRLGGSAAIQQGRCLLSPPLPGWDGGRGPYQREVVVAGVVAGLLAFWAEALRAQRQAGPPAPAEAKPVGQTGELLMGQRGDGNSQRAAGPQPAAGKGLEHQTTPPMPQELAGDIGPAAPKKRHCPPLPTTCHFLGPRIPPPHSLTWSQRCSPRISGSPWRWWRGWLEALHRERAEWGQRRGGGKDAPRGASCSPAPVRAVQPTCPGQQGQAWAQQMLQLSAASNRVRGAPPVPHHPAVGPLHPGRTVRAVLIFPAVGRGGGAGRRPGGLVSLCKRAKP